MPQIRFAILGLRSLHFLLAGVLRKFAYLEVGLAVVLIFVGAKMLLADLYKVPVGISLLAIMSILGISMLASLAKGKQPRGPDPREAAHA